MERELQAVDCSTSYVWLRNKDEFSWKQPSVYMDQTPLLCSPKVYLSFLVLNLLSILNSFSRSVKSPI